MEALSLRGCDRLAPSAISTMLAALPLLRALRLGSVDDVSILAVLPSPLVVLEINGLPLGIHELKALLHACQRLGALRVLIMRDCPALDDALVGSLLRSCALLEHLDLAGCAAPHLHGSFLCARGCGSRSLRELRIDGTGLMRVPSDKCRSAAEAHGVSGLSAISSRAFDAVGRVFSALTPSTALVSTSLLPSQPPLPSRPPPAASADGFASLDMLSIQSVAGLDCSLVRSLLACTPRLRVLYLGVTGGGVRICVAALLASPLTSLVEMNLTRGELGPDLAAAFAEFCPALTTIRCIKCAHLDAAFAAALRACTALQVLEVVGCPCSDSELALIATVLPSAVELRTAGLKRAATVAWLTNWLEEQRCRWVPKAAHELASAEPLWHATAHDRSAVSAS